jgi:hypothetical protein
MTAGFLFLASEQAGAQMGASQDDGGRTGALEDGLKRMHLAGNADVVFLYGEKNAAASGARFLIDNARLFLDVDLGRDLGWNGRRLVEDASFYVEWDIARESQFQNKIGSLYLRLDRLADLEPLNVKVGRFLVPFGEEYLRQSEARPENPLISFSAAIPYGWSQGLLFFGPVVKDKIDYFFSLTSAQEGFNGDSGGKLQVDAKLDVHPVPWALLSLSGLRIGALGSASTPARSAVEWSGANLSSFGAGTSVTNVQDGAAVADDPDARLGETVAWEADVVLREKGLGRLWLGAGGLVVRSADLSRYDRRLRYWIAEGVLEGESLSPSLEPLYAALRYSAIGTWTPERGYLLGDLDAGSDLGYNSRSVSWVSVGIGVRLGPQLVVKAEYSWVEFDLVRGVPASLTALASGRSYLGIGLSASF